MRSAVSVITQHHFCIPVVSPGSVPSISDATTSPDAALPHSAVHSVMSGRDILGFLVYMCDHTLPPDATGATSELGIITASDSSSDSTDAEDAAGV